ncbi:MAG TPA: low molecular weight protein-tyrosine-phosphatase [Trebonia sp.]|jgi:protein-tyrosine phosphatase|nr:low molecular weight protein-tyrosine-phosphatase [Trebonia sp.]
MASRAVALPPPRNPSGPYRVCFVCLGNICRSPMAEVVARAQLAGAGLTRAVVVDSAGTGDWHIGAPMDPGARAQLSHGGYDGEAHRARQFDPSWLADRDLVLAMDKSNFKTLKSSTITHDGDSSRIRLFGDVTGLAGADIPDPYLDAAEFAQVMEMIESAMPALIAQLKNVL